MDFLKILRSFEEFIFEATTWLVFYPLTLWRIVRGPLAAMDYSDREQGEPEERRYDDSISPPLVLLATIVVANLISVAVHIPPPEGASDLTKVLTASPERLVLFRSLVFSLVPLICALTLLRRQGRKVSRDSLRPPFYAQCYLAAPSAGLISAGGIIQTSPMVPNWLGFVCVGIGTIWFLVMQTRWFRKRLAVSWLNAGITTAWAVTRALIYLFVILVPVALI